MPTPLTDADKVLRNDTGIDIATNIASIASALTPSNITDLGDVNLTNPITDGQVIKYDTATQKWVNGLGNITMECTQAQYDAWKQSGQLKPNTLYVITDAPNLNATAQQISYDGGADTVWDKVESLNTNKSNLIIKQVFTTSYTVEANSYVNIDSSFIVIPSGYSFLGVVGWSTNDINVVIPSMRPFESGIYSIQLKNVSSSSRTNSLNIFCLFIKNS